VGLSFDRLLCYGYCTIHKEAVQLKTRTFALY